MTKCNNKCMCGRNIHDKDEKKQKQQKQTVLWTVYHTVLAVELAIIILIDTFRNEIINFLPGLNPAFNSFYEIIADINSFIKDLIR